MAELVDTSLIADGNLVAYYRLSDTSDSKGSNTLTNNGSVTFAAGKYGNAADYGAANSSKWLDVATDLGIAGNADISISGWVKLRAEIGAGTWGIYKHQSTSGASRYFQLDYLYNGGTQQLQLNGAGTSVTHNVALGTTDWHHIVITRNVSGNATKLYLDGTNVVSGTIGSGTIGSSLFAIGGNGANYTSAFFDDVPVFSKVLSPTEVTALYIEQQSGAFLNFI